MGTSLKNDAVLILKDMELESWKELMACRKRVEDCLSIWYVAFVETDVYSKGDKLVVELIDDCSNCDDLDSEDLAVYKDYMKALKTFLKEINNMIVDKIPSKHCLVKTIKVYSDDPCEKDLGRVGIKINELEDEELKQLVSFLDKFDAKYKVQNFLPQSY